MTLLVPVLPLMDTVIAEPDVRLPHGIRYWSTVPKALIADYLALGIEWVHLVDMEGRRLGRMVDSCTVTEIAVVKEMVISVEGGIRTWQDARTYLSQAVDLVFLGHSDGWPLTFPGVGQSEVEHRVLYELPVSANSMLHEEQFVAAVELLIGFGVIPVLTGSLSLPDLVRLGNLAGVSSRRRLVLRPPQIASLEEWNAGLLLTGGFVQAIMVDQRSLDRLGVIPMLDAIRAIEAV